MVIHGPEIGLGFAGNSAKGGGLESVGGEQALGGIEDGALGMVERIRG
jgi:hypothetical protein